MNRNSCWLNFRVIALCFFILKFFISKTKQAMVMKFCGWIDPSRGSAVHRNCNSCFA